MSNVDTYKGNGSTERVEHFLALAPATYWKVKRDYEEKGISKDEILLVCKIDYIDSKAHTVTVLKHPSKASFYSSGPRVGKVKFLIDEFLNNFDNVDESIAKSSRESDQKAIVAELNAVQAEITLAMSDPAKLDSFIERDMPEKADDKTALPIVRPNLPTSVTGALQTGSMTSLMATGLNPSDVDTIKGELSKQQAVMVKRGNWISSRTQDLSVIINKQVPYLSEMAEVAEASISDAKEMCSDIQKSIDSLHLYTLKDVQILKLKEGKSADESVKLTICQQRLWMDEEAVVWLDTIDSEFDSSDRQEFFDGLKSSPELVNQIFPSERCVVAMASSRSTKKYSIEDYGIYGVSQMYEQNTLNCLLVRDGENISVVVSPEYAHQTLGNLFPSHDQTKSMFRGYGGENITYNDIRYTDAVKKHENLELNYKRLLILLCGLDHKHQIFGTFYEGEPSLEFVSMAFQERYFNFIHDSEGDGLLADKLPLNHREYVNSLNQDITEGSLVMININAGFSHYIIPAAFERPKDLDGVYGPNRNDFCVTETVANGRFYMGVVQVVNGKQIVKIPMHRRSRGERKEIKAVYDIAEALREHREDWCLVCIDNADYDSVNHYIHSRQARTKGVNRINMLRAIRNHILDIYTREKPVRDAVYKAVEEAGVVSGTKALAIIDAAVKLWRGANPSKDIVSTLGDTKMFNSILDCVHRITNINSTPKEQILETVRQTGVEPIRLSVDSKGRYVVYTKPKESEKDDRIEPFYWVGRQLVKPNKAGFTLNAKTWKGLKRDVSGEKNLWSIEDVSPFIAPKKVKFTTPKAKKQFFESLDSASAGHSMLKTLMADNIGAPCPDGSKIREQIIEEYYDSGDKSGHLSSPYLLIPIGYKSSDYGLQVIYVGGDAAKIVASVATDDVANEFIGDFTERLVNPDAVAKRLFSARASAKISSLGILLGDVEKTPEVLDGLCTYGFESGDTIRNRNYDMSLNAILSKKLKYVARDGGEIYLKDEFNDVDLDTLFGREVDSNLGVMVNPGCDDDIAIFIPKTTYGDKEFSEKLFAVLRESFYEEGKSWLGIRSSEYASVEVAILENTYPNSQIRHEGNNRRTCFTGNYEVTDEILEVQGHKFPVYRVNNWVLED
ncbi:hypothetical protein [Vibrio alginolyticus]|uniref:hypothetical protein n=1 Tax=Vibrio alginolyticus TaxID=663 RepID=UPI0006CA8B19|nr:hypothetical protein [Vibrio alginolyticus]KPM97487.1 hypothetical protein AOG25_13525 [Vibrio alginolyticus]